MSLLEVKCELYLGQRAEDLVLIHARSSEEEGIVHLTAQKSNDSLLLHAYRERVKKDAQSESTICFTHGPGIPRQRG